MPLPLTPVRRTRAEQSPETTHEREHTMSASDKMKNAAQDLKGKATEAVGKATNDDSKVAEGRRDQTAASAKKVGEDVKDVFKK